MPSQNRLLSGKSLHRYAIATAFLNLGACVSAESGAGGPIVVPPLDPNTYLMPLDPNSDAEDSISSFGVDVANSEIQVLVGHYDAQGGRLDLSILSGNQSREHDSIDLDTGGALKIIDSPGEYVEVYKSQDPISGTGIGVIGARSKSKFLPVEGRATYNGESGLFVFDGSFVYEVTGDAKALIDFTTGLLSVTITDLDGVVSNGLSEAGTIDNLATISIVGVDIDENGISGGSAVISDSKLLAQLTSEGILEVQGGFFGPAGDEIAGVFVLDDQSGSGNLLLEGWFVAD